MGLTETIEKVIKDFDKRKDKSDVWEKLKDKLKKEGFRDPSKIIADLGDDGAYEFLEVWGALDEHLKKKDYDWGGSCNGYNIDSIKTISKMEGAKGIIRILSEIGYQLPTYIEDRKSHVRVGDECVQFFKTLEKEGLYKNCTSIIKALKNLDYKDINSYETPAHAQLEYFIKIACIKEDPAGAMYILASKGYKIDKTIGLNKLDLSNIEKIAKEGKEEILVYLYNEVNTRLFQEYFNNLEAEKKKSTLKSILDYETKTELEGSNNRKLNREWLEKDYKDLLREIGFED